MLAEIYWNENRSMLIVESIETSSTERFDELSPEIVQRLDASIASSRPIVYKELCTEFGFGPQYAYDRVFQFSACNFSTRDGHPDIDDELNFITERVPCPTRHKCTKTYCNPSTLLSSREIQVIRLFARGNDEEMIAEQLFISRSTVHNHISNIYKKLCFSGCAHPDRLLISYAHHNKII